MSEKGFKRKLVAILSADVEGYSRLMRLDEADTVVTLKACRKIISRMIVGHHGRLRRGEELARSVEGTGCGLERGDVQSAPALNSTDSPRARTQRSQVT